MSTRFKNQLIGTVTLVALSIIILPYLLDGKKKLPQEKFHAIPFAPQFIGKKSLVVGLEHPHQPVAIKEKMGLVKSPMTERSTQGETMAKSGWIIQLGTLKSASGIYRLITRLREAGYQAHCYPRTPADGELNRIFIGPELSKDAMQIKIKPLHKLTGLNGRLQRFDPLNR